MSSSALSLPAVGIASPDAEPLSAIPDMPTQLASCRRCLLRALGRTARGLLLHQSPTDAVVAEKVNAEARPLTAPSLRQTLRTLHDLRMILTPPSDDDQPAPSDIDPEILAETYAFLRLVFVDYVPTDTVQALMAAAEGQRIDLAQLFLHCEMAIEGRRNHLSEGISA